MLPPTTTTSWCEREEGTEGGRGDRRPGDGGAAAAAGGSVAAAGGSAAATGHERAWEICLGAAGGRDLARGGAREEVGFLGGAESMGAAAHDESGM
jgi:hypothetical protein